MLKIVSLLCDTESLHALFTDLGFTVMVHKDLTASAMRSEIRELGRRNFLNEDALVSSATYLQRFNIILYFSLY